MQRFSTTRHQMMMLIIASLGMIALVAPVAATGPAQQPPSPGTLRVAMPEPASLDPSALSRFDDAGRDLAENLFVGLTRFDPQTRQIEPVLATDWSVSDDGLTWTVSLRDDIHWVRVDPATQTVEDVRPVVAGDFVYAVQRACDPTRPTPVTANLMIVRGCQTVANAFPGRVDALFIAREIGVRATGPYTLEIDLMFPSGYFPSLLSTPEFRPLARETIPEANTGAAPLLTNGPYALAGPTATGLTLVRNPHWPDALSGNIDRVEVTFTPADDLLTPETIDFARLSPSQTAAARAATPELVRTAPGQSVVLLGFSLERGVINDPLARRALALTIDRESLAATLLPDSYQPAPGFTPPGVVAAPENTPFTFAPDQAQATFDAAGYTGCDGVPEKMTFYVPDDDPVWAEMARQIVAGWTAELGCNPALFEISMLPRPTVIELSHATYDPEQFARAHIWLAAWRGDYPDANAWINDGLHCRYGYLRTGRACAPADEWLDQAALDTNPAERAALYSRIEEQFFGPEGSFPVVPLFVSTTGWLQQPWLSDVNDYGPARFDQWQLAATP